MHDAPQAVIFTRYSLPRLLTLFRRPPAPVTPYFRQKPRLEVLFLDPEDEYRLVRSETLPLALDEVSLHRNALMCDGSRLVMLAQRNVELIRRTAGAPFKRGVVVFALSGRDDWW